MSLESADYIKDLEESNPKGIDSFTYENDHVILIKKVLKKTFPDFHSASSISDLNLNNLSSWLSFSDTSAETTIKIKTTFTGYTDLVSTNQNKNLTIKSDNLVKKVDGLGVLSSIFWSVLTENQMTAEYGNSFSLCDGRSIVGSVLYNLQGIRNVPDMITNSMSIVMRESSASLKYDTDVNKTTYKYYKYDTDISRISFNLSPDFHDHGKGMHEHVLGVFYTNQLIPGNPPYPDNYLFSTATFTSITAATSTSSEMYPFQHNHIINLTSLNSETTPPAIFLNPYMRIN